MRHTKKIIIGILVMLMALTSTLALTACGDIYGGKYTEVTDEVKISQIMDDIETTMENSEGWTGFKLSINASNKNGDKAFEYKSTMYMVMDEKGNPDQISMELIVNAGKKIEINFYAKDGSFYLNAKANGKTEKFKIANEQLIYLALKSFLPDTIDADGIFDNMDISDIFDQIDDIAENDVKIFITAESGARNIKISNEDGSSFAVIALDKDSKLKGMKVESNVNGTKTTLAMEQFSGSINLPKDLDSYTDFSFGL